MRSFLIFVILYTIICQTAYCLIGKVSYTDGTSIKDANITIINNQNLNNTYTTTTDINGDYSIDIDNATPKGIHNITVKIDPISETLLFNVSVYSQTDIEISLFNISGSKITSIISQPFNVGEYNISWSYSSYKHYLINHIFLLSLRSKNNFITSKFIIKDRPTTQSFYTDNYPINDYGHNELSATSYKITITGNDFNEHCIQNIDLSNKEELNITINKNTWVPYKCQGKYFGQYNGDSYQSIFIKGVNLGGGIPGTYPSQMAPSAGQYAKWFEQMTDVGFNLIRVYTLHYPRFYEELKKYNEAHPDKPLYVLHGAWLDEEYEGFATDPDLFNSIITYLPDWNEGTEPQTMTIMDYFDNRVKEVIDVIHGNANLTSRPGWASGNYTADISPWLIGYIIGREIYAIEVTKTNANEENQNFTHLYGDVFNLEEGSPAEVWAAQRLDKAMSYENEKYNEQHPISFSSWPSLDPIDHPTETGWEDLVSIDLDRIDETNAPAGYFASYHVYPYFPDFMVCDPGYREYSDNYGENSYLGYLYDLKSHYQNRPLIISEYGVSSGWGTSRFSTNGMHHGGLDEVQQGDYIIRMMNNIKESGCGGGMLFSWIDEWFKYVWIFGQTTNPHTRPRWHNIFSAEENYGLITFIPNEPDFSEFGFISHSDDISQGRVDYDTEGFYVKTILDRPLTNNDTLWIALDTYDQGKGESKLPNGKLVYNRAEFCASITTTKAQLFVTKAYNMYGIGQEGFPKSGQYFRSIASNNGLWEKVKWKNHRDTSFCAGTIFNAGDLQIRNNSSPTRHDAVIIDGNEVIIKLPWGILNFNDPSQRQVSHITDYSLNGINYTQTTSSEGIATTIYLGDSRLTIPRYTWEKWDEYHMPETVEYKKSSYFTIKKGFKNFEQHPTD